jgi:hypothetical protein
MKLNQPDRLQLHLLLVDDHPIVLQQIKFLLS